MRSLAARSGRATSAAVSGLLCLTHLLFGFAQLADADIDCPGLASNTSLCPPQQRPGGLVAASLTTSVAYDARGELAAAMSAAVSGLE